MTQQQLEEILRVLLQCPEGRIIEFKAARNQYDEDKLGRYFTALANEANLTNADSAWIILGVDDSRSVVGTQYLRGDRDERQLRMKVEEGTQPSSGFRDIHELVTEKGRVLLFEVPPAPRGIPMAWKGHYYARDGENLVSLTLDKIDEIRQQTLADDWTAAIVPGAAIQHLDPAALTKAREAFAVKHPEAAEEISAWTDTEFTDRARITLNGGITRTALLLLGRSEAGAFLTPHMAQASWRLLGEEEAYEHFGPPFLLTTSRLYQRIRNVQIKLMRPGSMIPDEVSKYDQRIVMEALHNCLAHQDYRRDARIIVTEYPDRLEFISRGSFYDGLPEEYVTTDRIPRSYRNPFLVQAMANLGMIDTMGYGIRMMTTRQAKRYLPLPDYDLTAKDEVKLTVYGRVVDEAYTRILMEHSDLPLVDILGLDRVQKHLPIDKTMRQHLRRTGLIEGRAPHLYVAASVAAVTDRRSEYIRTRVQGDAHYASLVLNFIDQYGQATRHDIDAMLVPLLSETLTDQQKSNKVSNLLAKMRRESVIHRDGPPSRAIWRRV